MNEHREEVTVMLMLRRDPVCRAGALRVVGKSTLIPVSIASWCGLQCVASIN
jgi:hypothetical protein